LQISIVVAALLAMGFIAATIFVCYAFADWLARVLGETGMTVVIRLSAFLLLCIGAQIVWNGVHALPGSISVQMG
jgi:multiple antibiotic resistance protein